VFFASLCSGRRRRPLIYYRWLEYT
ncbi:hypothetical protein VCHENC02_4098B, partial [Vibrio harveyi]